MQARYKSDNGAHEVLASAPSVSKKEGKQYIMRPNSDSSYRISEKKKKAKLPTAPKDKPYEIFPFATNKTNIKQRKAMEEGIIPPFSSSVIINGKTGSGKSNLLISLLCRPEFYGVSKELPPSEHQKEKEQGKIKPCHFFDEIYLFSPCAGVLDDLSNTLEEHAGLEKKHIYNTFDEKTLETILDSQFAEISKVGIDKAKKICIILDDIQSNAKFLRSEMIKRIFIAGRHYNIMTFICSQSFKLIPRSCRLQANSIMIFPAQQSEVKILVDEFTPAGLDKKEMLEILQKATEKPYEFLHINMRHPPLTRFRKNLDTVFKLKKECFNCVPES